MPFSQRPNDYAQVITQIFMNEDLRQVQGYWQWGVVVSNLPINN